MTCCFQSPNSLFEVLRRRCVFCEEPFHLGSLADFVISVFGKASFNTVLSGCHFDRTFRI